MSTTSLGRIAKQNSSSSEEEEEDASWIEWFCSLKGNEIFSEVTDEFILDNFNLTGLNKIVDNYADAYKIITDQASESEDEDDNQEILENSAESLYGLIHARFILTPRGMNIMASKYKRAEFGRCPRVLCEGVHLLPCGQSDEMNTNSVKFFCPGCQDIYTSKNPLHKNIDGAYFGTTFCNLFFLYYPQYLPTKPFEKFVPRIYGYKIHPSSRQRQEEELNLYRERQRKAIQQKQLNVASILEI